MRPFLPVLALTAFLAACSGPIEYSVKNDSGEEMTKVVVTTDSGYSFSHGVIPPGAHKSYSGGENMKGENQVTISWTDSSGSRQNAVVLVGDKELHDPRQLVLRITESAAVEKQWRFEDPK